MKRPLDIYAVLKRLWYGGLLCVCAGSHASAGELQQVQRQEHGGIAVEFRFEPRDGSTTAREQSGSLLQGETHITFTDAVSGRPFEGMRPAAWMVARRSQQVADEFSCEAKARQLRTGSLGSRADIDLNAYRLVTLNQDNTVAFINPLVNLKNSKLESIVQLPSAGYDWVLVPEHHRLLVSLRETDAVAVIDTITRKLLGEVAFPVGSQPTRILLDGDGTRVWVGLDGRNEVGVIDAARMTEVARVPVGHGWHTLAGATDKNWMFVTNTEDSTVSIIDRDRMQHLTDVSVGKTPVAISWSPAAQRVAVATRTGGTLELIDPVQGIVAATVPLAPGVVELGLFDQGRYAFALNQLESRATIVDLAMASVKGSIAVVTKPDQISFSKEFAYVRGQGSANVSAMNLQQARSGQLQVLSIPMGQRAPQDAPESIGVASMMAPAPEGNGVVVANAPDRILYRYAEGLMAPVGNFSNYKRMARALLVLDSSLSERGIGQFVAPTTFEFGGRFDVIVKTLHPAVTACFTVTVDGPTKRTVGADAIPTIAAKLGTISPVPGGDERAVMVMLTDAQHHPLIGITDAVLLAVQQHGLWQRRVAIRELGEGRYEAQLLFPESGDFELLITVPSHQLTFTEGHLGRVSLPETPRATTAVPPQTGARHAVR